MPEITIVRLSDVTARGATYREARRSVEGLARLARGSYADTTGMAAEREHLVRAQALQGTIRGVVTSHTSAALAWGLPVPRAELAIVHLSPGTGRRGGPKSAPGYHLHCRVVADSEVVPILDQHVTEPLRTVVDSASVLDLDWAVALGDAALREGLIEAVALRESTTSVRRLKGAARMRALPELCSGLAESPGESLLRMRLNRLGVAFAEQVTLPGVEGHPRVDFLVEGRLIVEFDGRAKYSMNGDPARAHWEEKRRHDRVVEAGYEVIRVVWDQLWDEPDLRRRINRALHKVARHPAPS